MPAALLALLVALAAAQDALLDRSRRATSVYDLNDVLAGLVAQNAGLQSTASAAVAQAQSLAAANNQATIQLLGPLAATSLGAASSRLSDLENLVGDIQRTSSVELPNLITNVNTELSQRIANEASLRAAVSATLQSLVTSVTTSVNAGFANAATARTQVRTDMSSARATVLSSAQSSISAALSSEVVRASTEAATLSTQIAALTSTYVASISTKIAAEASSADAACRTKVNNNIGTISVQSGSTDYGTCTAGQTGQMYYSQQNRNIFLCANSYWGTFAFGSFNDSTILNHNQAKNLVAAVGHPRWQLCYRATRDGFNSYIFHMNCNNKGQTMSIIKANNGRVWGGYTDVFWMCRNTWVPTSSPWLYRFNPSTTDVVEKAFVQYAPNAMYDYWSYGPTYGGGHDMYLNSNMNAGYCGASSYVLSPTATGSYDNNWLCGSYSSWSTTEIEVYYNA